MNNPNWRPIGDKVLVKKIDIEEEKTSSGLFVVSSEKNDITKKALVVSVGSGKLVNGKTVPLEVNEGDTIIYNGMYGTDIGSFHSANTNEYMILHADDIIAILNS